MDFSSASSEWSSGCESGWTFYLNESISQPPKTTRKAFHDHQQSCRPDANEEEEEEDLSMVSDASSGPPQFHHEEQCKENSQFRFSSTTTTKKKNKLKEHCFLDDTASSPALNYPIEYMNKSHNQHAFGFSHGNGLMGDYAFGDQTGIGRQQEQAETSRSLPMRRR